MHRSRDHADLRTVCRADGCNLSFLTAERERAHFYKIHMQLKCGVDGCNKAEHVYSNWKKLKNHLDAAHCDAGSAAITSIASVVANSDVNDSLLQSQVQAQPALDVARQQQQHQQRQLSEERKEAASDQRKHLDTIMSAAMSADGDERVKLLDTYNLIFAFYNQNSVCHTATNAMSQEEQDGVAQSAPVDRKRKHAVLQTLESAPADRFDFFCHECNRAYESAKGLKRHNDDLHNDTKTCECKECGETFKTSALRQQHRESVHLHKKRRRTLYCCDVLGCSHTVSDKDALQIHKFKAHAIGTFPEYKCPYCPSERKSFVKISNVNKHIRQEHSNEKPVSKSMFASTEQK